MYIKYIIIYILYIYIYIYITNGKLAKNVRVTLHLKLQHKKCKNNTEILLFKL